MTAQMMAIGDSHCLFWGDLAPAVLTYHVGPALAWSLAEGGSHVQGREKALAALRGLPSHTWALLCFGEIDIRCHVLAKGRAGPVPCAERYFGFVLEAKAAHRRTAIWAPTATQATAVPDDLDYPTVGSAAARNEATRAFTAQLSESGAAHGVPVISIFDLMVDARGATRADALADGRHAAKWLRSAAIARVNRALGTDIREGSGR